MKLKLMLFIICGIITMAPAVPVECQNNKKGYSITLQISNPTDRVTLYLQKYSGKTLIPIDSAKLTVKTNHIFSSAELLTPGMYVIVIKPAGSIDFFISDGESQIFTVNADFNNLIQSVSFKNSRENQLFADFRRFMEAKRIRNPGQQVQINMVKELQDFEKVSLKSMLGLFIRTINDPAVPDPKIPVFVLNREQAIQNYNYQYILNHFFDNFDFSDERILRMPVFEEKTNLYFGQIVNPVPDTLILRVGQLLKKTKANHVVYNWTVRYLYNYFRISSRPGSTDVHHYIAEQYILKEPGRWNDPAFLAKVRERITRSNQNKIGQPAVNLILKTPEGKNKSLHNITAPLTVLYFFNPGCEACLPITDALFQLFKKYRQKGIRVYAVYLDRKKEDWIKYIQTKNLDWENVYDPDGSQGIEQKYDIYAIPMIYLLDKDKKVIKKDITVEYLDTYLAGAGLVK